VLVNLGEAAFVRGNYEWTIEFIEQARWLGGDLLSAVGMYNYPYLAGAYLFKYKDLPSFTNALKEMTRRMRLLGDLATISKAITQLSVLRRLVANQAQKALDEVMNDLLEMKTAYSTSSPTRVARTVCYFRGSDYGSFYPFFPARGVHYSDAAHLDRNYQQASFQSSSRDFSDPCWWEEHKKGVAPASRLRLRVVENGLCKSLDSFQTDSVLRSLVVSTPRIRIFVSHLIAMASASGTIAKSAPR